MIRIIKKDKHISREGDVCRNVFFLFKGFVRMYYVDWEGNKISYRFMDKGNFFVDFQSFLTQQPSRYYWQATQDSALLSLPYEEVQKIYKTSPAWNNFARLTAERVYLQLNERIEMLLFIKPEERYLHVLAKQPQLLKQYVRKYIQCHRIEASLPGLPEPYYDGITELWFDDAEAIGKLFGVRRLHANHSS